MSGGRPMRPVPGSRGRPDRAGPGRTPAVGAAAALAAAALAMASLAPAPAAAQAGPSEASPGFADEQGEAPPLGWRGDADLGFTFTEGNSETTSLSLAARAVRRGEGDRWTLEGGLVRTTTDGEVEADQGDLAVQYDWFAAGPTYLFGRAAASYNEPAGIDFRLAPAAGVGWQALERERMELSLEGGASWIRDGFADGTTAEDFFLVASESFHLRLAEDTELTQALTWEPNTSDFGDFLLDAEVKLSTMITETLGLQLTLRDQYDSEPFEDPATGERREENDLTFVTGVTFRF